MHFFRMLQILTLFRENMGAGNDSLQWTQRKTWMQHMQARMFSNTVGVEPSSNVMWFVISLEKEFFFLAKRCHQRYCDIKKTREQHEWKQSGDMLRQHRGVCMSRCEKGAIDQTERDNVFIFWNKRNGVMNLYQMDWISAAFYQPKHNIQTVSTCYQQIHGAGMQHYLCFLMPFFCGTDPLFFWLSPSTSASLKLDSDPPSQDSSESKPEEERRLQLWKIWEQTLKHIVTEIFMRNPDMYLFQFNFI